MGAVVLSTATKLPNGWAYRLPESTFLAVVLVFIGQLNDLFSRLLSCSASLDYVQAGLGEELLFRAGLFSSMAVALMRLGIKQINAEIVAMVASSLLFSLGHHYVIGGEPFTWFAFIFRFEAGLFFTAVFGCRGYWTAATTHTFYDLLVGIVIPFLAPEGGK